MKISFWHIILSLSLLALLLSACKPQSPLVPEPLPPPTEKEGILFLGHIYRRWHRDKVDERIEILQQKCQYESIWLGGDICGETADQWSTLTYLDSLFDLDSPNTLWAYGNHDMRNGNHDWLREMTGRELHYVQHYPGMTVLVTNTAYQANMDCDQWEDQFEMIQAVCDTISQASHLLMLSHHVTWSNVEAGMQADSAGNANSSWFPYRCEPLSQFRWLIYPLLQQVQARGVQVVVISGDVGKKDKTYQHQTSDGIWFLASGINNSVEADSAKRAELPKDHILHLNYEETVGLLDWSFLDLDSLLEAQE